MDDVTVPRPVAPDRNRSAAAASRARTRLTAAEPTAILVESTAASIDPPTATSIDVLYVRYEPFHYFFTY
ncbi:hypothetical protein GCM10010358_43220 [Streptomyces minutiscleroticus]|uniref:Uncharacterized protein n=1 Tax=Streptomyces minutiscleroticus TaxID=68238 RepID=A0A918U325_9ACTN|nr:hypothetical protein [Streptomyces minutiscleroticus]GGX84381.1 hypothetical protein GCM10010358_43220 [Streptomyces minutiscleroticus]